MLRLVRSPGPLVASYFLRADAMHGLFIYPEDNPSADLRRERSQVLCATHSSLLASLPGATLLECGDHGLRESAYADLELVRDWRDYLAAPDRYLSHLLGP